jgi:hypothetical protein
LSFTGSSILSGASKRGVDILLEVADDLRVLGVPKRAH